jgi:hypothetical protein
MKQFYFHNVMNGLHTDEVEEIKYLQSTPVRNISRLPKRKVYISLTTSPIRLPKIGIMLNTLDLTHIYEIHINLPKLYRNEPDEKYSVEDIEYVKSLDDRIRVYRVSKDIGPLTKIYPTIKRVTDLNALIISVDDDIGYPYSLVNELIYASYKYPQNVVTGAGIKFGDYDGSDFDRSKWSRSKRPRGRFVDIVEGWGGVCYPKRLMVRDVMNLIMELNNVSTTCKLSDDFTISYSLADFDIKSREVNTKYYNRDMLYPFSYGEMADALHKGSGVMCTGSDDENMAKYHVCLDDIWRYFH